ncbi:hypothetical protein INT43_006918, partial [Umbelopsis isabellina]
DITMVKDAQLDQMAADMSLARQNPAFDINLMENFLIGGEEALSEREEGRAILEKEPLFEKSQLVFMSREERLRHGIKVATRLIELWEEHGWSPDQFAAVIRSIDMMTPLLSAFIPVILSQGSDEQVQKWIGAALKHSIIGCYAQTELGHGSNVAGLMTTATFDRHSDEFVLHSPSLAAAKWWIGGLGVLATHAVVQAQLIIDGKNYGPHIFVSPIRDPETHKPEPNILVGDIGPKAYGGFASMDNGYLLFKEHRIPRENMLMKFAKVDKDGVYRPPVHSKLSYGSMVKLRAMMVPEAGWKLGQALTVSVRYCTVRRQFQPANLNKADEPTAGPESQVISYSGVQHRLFPLISVAYGLIIAGFTVTRLFDEMTEQLAVEDATLLPQVHVLTCGLKSWGTRRACDGIEECRKAMGGHGYSAFSGLSDLFASYIPSNTYEGDNWILTQQVARFLVKELGKLANGKEVSATTSYLARLATGDVSSSFRVSSSQQLLDLNVQVDLFATRAARVAYELGQALQSGRPWSDLNVECWNASIAHTEYTVMRSFADKVEEIQKDQYAPLHSSIKVLCDLFAVSNIVGASQASFLSTQTIHAADLPVINELYRSLLKKVAKEAVPLTDAFGFSDRVLGSALGRKDGRAYEALWEAVQRNPVNHDKWKKETYETTIKQLLHRGDADAVEKAKL